MKALVLEIKDGTAAVLREDGVVVKVRRKCEVGQTIELDGGVRRLSARALRYIGAAAAALVFAVCGGTYSYLTAFACSYVSLDVNPSIEYALNRLDRVVSVSALNDGAQAVVEALTSDGVKNKTLGEAIDDTLDILYSEDYLGSGEGDYMLVSVSSDSEKTAEALKETVTGAVGDGRDGALTLCVVNVGIDERDAAAENGISAGRYEAMKEITGAGGQSGEGASQPEEDSVAQYKDMPLDELLKDAGRLPNEAADGDSQPQGGDGQDGGQQAGSSREDASGPQGSEQPASQPQPGQQAQAPSVLSGGQDDESEQSGSAVEDAAGRPEQQGQSQETGAAAPARP